MLTWVQHDTTLATVKDGLEADMRGLSRVASSVAAQRPAKARAA
jgi:hypothetical protein